MEGFGNWIAKLVLFVKSQSFLTSFLLISDKFRLISWLKEQCWVPKHSIECPIYLPNFPPLSHPMRIIGGQWRGRSLPTRKGAKYRPTTDRAREALFNALGHRIELTDARLLDLFSGSGALGLEAVSRGAAVTAVELDNQTARYLRTLYAEWGLDSKRVLNRRAEVFLRAAAQAAERWDVILADPPYAHGGKPELVVLMLSCLAPDGWAVLEHPTGENYESVPGWVETRVYGQSAFSWFAKPDEPLDDAPEADETTPPSEA
jgi:16S rRNA (guanine(966)-N(2))-methyltransferase RsmD